METKNITKAILEVMKDIKGIEKDSNVGSGSYGYKGVSDYQVKLVIGRSMQAHGLAMIPISVEDETQFSEWDDQGKHKQSTFTKVKTKYLLLHDSGESLEISGYGHGVDNQDKGAGKATTYALKYAMLYTFLVPTGEIDDTENTHSNEIPVKSSSPSVTTAVKVTKDEPFDGKVPCKECGGSTTFRKGTAKTGKPYQAYFCNENRDHKPFFVN